jgi:hypothetical protein
MMLAKPATPVLNVTIDQKVEIMHVMFDPILGALRGMAPEKNVSADDIIDFFALGIAMILDNDTNLTTPELLRLGAISATKMIDTRANQLRESRDETGMSLLAIILEEAQRGDAPPN